MVTINESIIKTAFMGVVGYGFGYVAKIDPKLMALTWVIGTVANEIFKRNSSFNPEVGKCTSIGICAGIMTIYHPNDLNKRFWGIFAFAMMISLLNNIKLTLHHRQVQPLQET